MSLSDSIDDYLRSIATLVESLEEESRRAEVAGRKIGQLRLRQQIDGGYGQVTVDLFGRLCSVDLEKSKLTHVNGDHLARKVTQAINVAEARARALHKQLAMKSGSL